ncbi:MAG: preprotein translocase subunit YajC [Treponemataceae bacterium]|nr:preprotein translocase subunit YajC [Treponemataceae bacterium]
MAFLPLTGAGAAGGAAGLMSMLPILLIFVIFYFLLIRPQNKKQKETEKMIAALKKGDKVVTIGGIHGVVTSTKEKTVIVKVDDNTKIEFTRSAIASVELDEKAKNEKAEKKQDKSENETKAVEAGSETEENK